MNELNMCAKEKCADGEVKNINGYCVRIVEKGCVDDDGCVNGRCGSEKVCKCYDGFGKDANGECTRKGNNHNIICVDTYTTTMYSRFAPLTLLLLGTF